MPIFLEDDDIDFDTQSEVTTAEVDKKATDYMTQYNRGMDRGVLSTTASFAGGATIDLLDTVASSVIPGLERQDINNKFLATIGSPGFNNWFNQNQGSLEIGSGIAGTVLSTWAAGKLLNSGGKAMQAIRGVPYAGKIAQLDSRYEKSLQLARLTEAESARRGAMGVDRFMAETMTLPQLGRAGIPITTAQASRGVYASALTRGLVQNATTEAIMATTLHTNSMLYSDSLAHNLAWSAAGLGLGAGLDMLTSTYALRKIANSNEIRTLNRKAFDVSGIESQRLGAFGVADSIRRTATGEPLAGDLTWIHGGRSAVTDEITSYAIQASELAKAPGLGASQRKKSLFSRAEPMATPIWNQAFEKINEITTRGLRGLSETRFGTKAEGLGKPLNQSLYLDPTSLYGIDEIGTVPAGMTRTEAVSSRQRKLDSAFNVNQELLGNGGKWTRKRVKTVDGDVFEDKLVPLKDGEVEAIRAAQLELHNARSLTPVTMLEPGEWSPMSWGQIADNYEPRKVKVAGSLGKDDLAVWEVERAPHEGRIGLSSHGDIFLPDAAKGKLENLTPTDSLHFYNAAHQAVSDMAENGDVFTLPKSASWAELDLAGELIKATGDPSRVKFHGSMTLEEAMVESFAQKVDILKRKQNTKKLNARRGLEDSMTDADAYALKVQLNLPRLTPYQQGLMNSGEHPIDVLLHGFESGKQVRSMTYQELMKTINDARAIQGFTENSKEGLNQLRGTSYNFLRDAEGQAMGAIIGMRRPMRPQEWSRDTLFVRQALSELHVRDALIGPKADAMTRAITDGLASHPGFGTARNITELADTQSRSFIPGATGAAPQTTAGSFLNSITSRARRDVDNMTMLAASQIQELKTRLTQAAAKDIFDRNLGQLRELMSSNRNAKSKMLVDQFSSFRHGWEIGVKPKEISLPDGKKGYTFVLDHEHVGNQKRFQQAFGRELAKGQELLNPNGQPIVLDELGLAYRTAMQGVHKETLAAKNTLLRSQGLPEIKETPWYVAPPRDKNKYVEYVFDIADQPVPGMRIVAETPEALAAMKAEVIQSAQWKDGYTFKSRDSVKSFMTLWDKAQMEFIAPNVTAIQPKKQNFGISGGNLHNAKAMEEELATALDSILRHGDDLIDVLYDPVIKAGRSRAAVAKVATKAGSRRAVEHSSIYDRHLQNLTGRSSLSAKDSFFGNAYEWAEQRINGFIQMDPVQKVGAARDTMFDYIRAANPFDKQQLPKERFKEFSKALGPYMPFENVTKMIERETGSRTPTEIAEISSKLSWFEASSRLRWFESMHAMVNFGSMIANMPAVVRALQPMKGESAAEAALRNSNITMLMNVGSQEQVVLPNVQRLLWQSMRDAQKSLPDEFTNKAIARGFMGQEVAELNRGFEAIQSPSSFKRFFFGDPNAKTWFGKKGVDGVIDFASSKSEDFSRAWGMYAGKRVAEAMGITKVDDQLNFAHGLVNELIANYDPRNRPEIFQGALGAPLGLFQSYALNFYQRMFRYLETGNTRALATQYAMQSAIFGTSSVPGWDQINWAFFDYGQGKTGPDGEYQDPIESLTHRLGKDAADLYMHGLLSNLPKLFGGEGMALFTRGDTQFRSPVNPLNLVKGDAAVSIPVTDTIGRIVDGIGQALGQFRAMNGNIGLNQLAEIGSNVITNRPIAGMLEVFGANGYDTDSAGQVVAESTLPSIAAAYRVLGTRTMAQQKEVEQFYASRNAQTEQAARKDVLNVATRQAIRDERYDDIPELFAKYVQEGGNPQYYSAWIKRSFDAGLNTRGERMLKKALNDKNNQSNNFIARLIDGEVDTAEDEANTDDYGREAAMAQLIEDGWETQPTAPGLEDRINESETIDGW